MKIQEATKRETLHIALGVLSFSLVMNLILILLGRWELPVLWGTLLGGGYAVLNFLALGLTVQKVASDSNEKRGKLTMQLSYTLRMLFALVVIVFAIKTPWIRWPAAVLPLLFPRLTILCMQLLGMYKPQALQHEEGGDDPV